MKLFLCSHFSSVGSLIKEEIENKKVAFIPTASLREGYTGYVGSARKLFKKLGAIVTEIDISTEAYSTIQSVFEDADVIYFTGGNSFFLIDQLGEPKSVFMETSNTFDSNFNVSVFGTVSPFSQRETA